MPKPEDEAQTRLGDPSYGSDIWRVFRIGVEKCGFLWTVKEAHDFWEGYSDSQCAQWLIVPNNDDELVRELLEYKNG